MCVPVCYDSILSPPSPMSHKYKAHTQSLTFLCKCPPSTSPTATIKRQKREKQQMEVKEKDEEEVMKRSGRLSREKPRPSAG